MDEDKDPESTNVEKRETWSRKIDFLIALVGGSVGLGNVWRFPYLCYKNGGGAFLIPYFTCVLLCQVPLLFLEVSLGQFMSSGSFGAWMICPLLQGFGYAAVSVIFLTNIYYNVILTWSFYYVFSSFTSVLPWSHCDNEWNTDQCTGQLKKLLDNNVTQGRDGQPLNGTHAIDPVVEFWEHKVLGISDGIENIGGIKWDLALTLLLAWIVVFACIFKGIKTSGKVMYVTASTPYLLMLIILIRGCTLPGAAEGIKFYLLPDWNKVLDMQVWVDAGTQIFFSSSIGFGTLVALGSYNTPHHNCWRDCIWYSIVNCSTSLFAGFVIFPILGFMAHEQGLSVADVAESGPGLAFIAYPKAVAVMPFCPPLWSVIFFIMLILLGLDSQLVGVEGVITACVDEYSHILRRKYVKELFVLAICVFNYLIGLTMVTQGGMYIFQIFDYYLGSRIILLLGFIECMIIAWIYGADRFFDDLQAMLGFKVSPILKYCWKFVTPSFSLLLFVMSAYSYSDLSYERPTMVYIYPRWAIIMGWIVACVPLCLLVGITIMKIYKQPGESTYQKIQELLKPQIPKERIHPKYAEDKTMADNGEAIGLTMDVITDKPLTVNSDINKETDPCL